MSEHLITYSYVSYSLNENNMIEARHTLGDKFLLTVKLEDLINVCQLAADRIVKRYSEESRSNPEVK